jgi:hypothetical protein
MCPGRREPTHTYEQALASTPIDTSVDVVMDGLFRRGCGEWQGWTADPGLDALAPEQRLAHALK